MNGEFVESGCGLVGVVLADISPARLSLMAAKSLLVSVEEETYKRIQQVLGEEVFGNLEV